MAEKRKRQQKEEKLRNEVTRCILLSQEDKDFWLNNVETLPDHVLENVLKIVQEKNSKVDEYITSALTEDKDHKYLSELKSKIAEIKKNAFEISEEEEKESAEDVLTEELKQLDG